MLLLLTSLLLLQAPPTAPPDGPSVASFAAFMSDGLPREFDDFTLVSVRAEGDLLIFTFDGARGWRQRVSHQDLARETIDGLCAEGDFLSQIHASGVRLDRLEEGRDLQVGADTSRCPPPAAS